MSIIEAAESGTDAELTDALIGWSERNPDANIGVPMLHMSAVARDRVRIAYRRAFHAPLGGWVTGP